MSRKVYNSAKITVIGDVKFKVSAKHASKKNVKITAKSLEQETFSRAEKKVIKPMRK